MPTIKEFDKLCDRFTDKTPGCALAVSVRGKVVHRGFYGMADVRGKVRVGPDTRFNIGSVSKQFTTFLILTLEGDRKIALDDDFQKYLPEFPSYGKTITIRHLIHHTSGLRDFLRLFALAGQKIWDRSASDLMKIALRQRGLNFNPGTEHLYSNTGYFLLGQIVEKASGRSLGSYAQEVIFGPLNMTRTRICGNPKDPAADTAFGYIWVNGSRRRVMRGGDRNTACLGSTNVLSTPEDLRRWQDALVYGGFGGRGMLRKMIRAGTLNSGQKLGYAAGLRLLKYRGRRVVSHGGHVIGFLSRLAWVPSLGLTVACLRNEVGADESEVQNLTNRVIDFFDKRPRPVARIEGPDVQATLAQNPGLSGFAGIYQKVGAREWLVLKEKGSSIRAQALSHFVDMDLVKGSTFQGRQGAWVKCRFEFRLGSDGRATDLQEYWSGKAGDKYRSLRFSGFDPQLLRQFAGDYYSPELDGWRRMEFRNDRLELVPFETASLPLQANLAKSDRRMAKIGKDRFFCDFKEITFVRNSRRRVIAMAMHYLHRDGVVARVRRLRFEKR